jgi:hypothetical protein
MAISGTQSDTSSRTIDRATSDTPHNCSLRFFAPICKTHPADVAKPQSDLPQARHAQTLALFEYLHEVARFHKGIVGAGVKPDKTAEKSQHANCLFQDNNDLRPWLRVRPERTALLIRQCRPPDCRKNRGR